MAISAMVTMGLEGEGMTSLIGNMARQYSGDALTGWARADTLRVMRLWRGRRWARLLAMVLLAASTRLPHFGPDDPACAPLFAGTPTGVPALTEGLGAAESPEHCAICHWTRLLRSPLTVSGVVAVIAAPPFLLSQAAAQFTAEPVD